MLSTLRAAPDPGMRHIQEETILFGSARGPPAIPSGLFLTADSLSASVNYRGEIWDRKCCAGANNLKTESEHTSLNSGPDIPQPSNIEPRAPESVSRNLQSCADPGPRNVSPLYTTNMFFPGLVALHQLGRKLLLLVISRGLKRKNRDANHKVLAFSIVTTVMNRM